MLHLCQVVAVKLEQVGLIVTECKQMADDFINCSLIK